MIEISRMRKPWFILKNSLSEKSLQSALDAHSYDKVKSVSYYFGLIRNPLSFRLRSNYRFSI